jgi:hypothetical protein
MTNTKTNNTNDFTKRTSATIKSIISQTNIFDGCQIENMGDNRSFSIIGRVDIKARVELKKTFGFIIEEVAFNTIYFKTY